MPPLPRENDPRENDPPPKDGAGHGMGLAQVAFSLPLCVVAGLLIGSALDHWLHRHWMYLAGLGLGIAAGFYEIVRVAISLSRESKMDDYSLNSGASSNKSDDTTKRPQMK